MRQKSQLLRELSKHTGATASYFSLAMRKTSKSVQNAVKGKAEKSYFFLEFIIVLLILMLAAFAITYILDQFFTHFVFNGEQQQWQVTR
jgi:membrane-associated PAP2 superfamily phosphatase